MKAQVDKALTFEIPKTTSLEDFFRLLGKIKQSQNFEDKMILLKDNMVRVFLSLNLDFFAVNITFSKTIILKFFIVWGVFESNLIEFHNSLPSLFIYFLLFDENSKNLFQYRVSLDGYWGELIWLSRGKNINGTSVMDIFKVLEDSFQVYLLYLLDDSTINFNIPTSHCSSRTTKKSFVLRLINLICEKLPLTWYQKNLGVWPSVCKNWKGINGLSITQSPSLFSEAVTQVRKTRIIVFSRLIHPFLYEKILSLCYKYFPYLQSALNAKPLNKPKLAQIDIIKTPKKKSLKVIFKKSDARFLVFPTVHELGKKILKACKASKVPSQKTIEFDSPTSDLINFCSLLLNPEKVFSLGDASGFYKAIRIVRSVQIFQRIRFERSNFFSEERRKETLFNMKFFRQKALLKHMQSIDRFIV